MRRPMLKLAGCCLAVVSITGEAAAGVHAETSKPRAAHAASKPPAAHAASKPPAAHAASKPPAPPSRRTPPRAIPLTNGWQFLADPRNVGLRQHWAMGGANHLHWTGVSIPNDFNPIVSNTSYAGTTYWYRVTFRAPGALANRSWNVTFNEVRRNATVWLNGRKLGTNTNPYAPFSFPATGLKPGKTNQLIVRVDNIKTRSSFPEDWWNWGGIVQPVSLQPVGRLALTDLGVMPQPGCNYRCGHVLVTGTLRNVSNTALTPTIGLQLTAPNGSKLSFQHHFPSLGPGKSDDVSFRVLIKSRPSLWAPDHPSLYKAQVTTGDGATVEQTNSMQVGFRTVEVKGGILYLNGKRLWLHGASIQEDVDGRGAALTNDNISTIVSELKSLGANVTRAHYLLSQPLLTALDKAGIMVWEQPPVDHADPLLVSGAGRRRALALLQSTVEGYRSHPSVIVDSVGNELSPTADTAPGTLAYMNAAIALGRELDPIAPIGLDIYGYPDIPPQRIYSKFDVLGVTDYFGWYTDHDLTDFTGLQPFLDTLHQALPNQALTIAEFGAESRFDGPVDVKGTYEFQSNYLQQTFGVLNQLPYINGAIYWTLREFAVNPGWVGGAELPADDPPDGIHHKGLIAYDGTEKPAFSVAQQLFADPPPYVH